MKSAKRDMTSKKRDTEGVTSSRAHAHYVGMSRCHGRDKGVTAPVTPPLALRAAASRVRLIDVVVNEAMEAAA